MKKFKVGDRVEHRSSVTGSVADVLPSGNYYVRLDRPAFPGDDCMWAFGESELSPLAPIPDGWTPASEPPDGGDYSRNVRVLLKGGREGYGFTWHKRWVVFDADADVERITTDMTYCGGALWDSNPGKVLAWREIEPERKADPRVRYCVAADLPTSITVWHDTFEAADAEAQRLCVKCGKPFRVLKVVEEVKPGNPVITKLEE